MKSKSEDGFAIEPSDQKALTEIVRGFLKRFRSYIRFGFAVLVVLNYSESALAQNQSDGVSGHPYPGVFYNISDHCRSRETLENDPKSIVELRCTNEYLSCQAEYLAHFGISIGHKSYCGNQALPLDKRFQGPCPYTLVEFEKSTYDTPLWWVARSDLRSQFVGSLGPNEELNSFRHEETTKNLFDLLSLDPTNLDVLDAVFYRGLYDVGSKEHIELEIARMRADPDCEWKQDTLTRSLMNLEDLIDDRDNSVSGLPTLSDAEVRKTATLVFDTVETTFNRAYHNSKNLRKVFAALQLTGFPIYDDGRVFISNVANYIDVDLEAFRRERLEFFLKDLIRTYGIDSVHGRTQALGMVCNDWSFELGLLEHCGTLVTQFNKSDLNTYGTLNDDVFNATVVLLLSLTRSCDELRDLSISAWDSIVQITVCKARLTPDTVMSLVEPLLQLGSPTGDPRVLLINAHATLSEYTPALFKQALLQEPRTLLHTLPLAKRLQQVGKQDDAIEIVETSYAVAHTLNLDNVLRDRAFLHMSGFLQEWHGIESFFLMDEESGGDGLVVSVDRITRVLQIALELLRAGNSIEFSDLGMSFLDVNS